MKRNILIAIDVDGTLRCNCTSTCNDPNPDIVHLANTLARFKNVRVMVWSGGGKDSRTVDVKQFKRTIAKQALLTLIREVGEESIGDNIPMEGATKQHSRVD